MSSFDNPVPYSIAWDPPCDFGSVILELYLLSFIVGGEGGSAVTVAWDCAVIQTYRRRFGGGVSGFVLGNTVAREVRNVAFMTAVGRWV